MTIRDIKPIILCLLAIGIFACSEGERSSPNGKGKQVTIALSIPGMEKDAPPMTYAMPADEDKINTIDVLVFKTDPQFPNDPKKGTYYYRAMVAHTEGSRTFITKFFESSNNQTIVVLANCRTEVTTLLETISLGDSKTDVIEALSLAQDTAFDPANMVGIPMWGEITNQHITTTYNPTNLTVELTRMLAKINIVNDDTDNFTLKEAFFYNPRQKGSIIPDNWAETTSGSVTTPTIVSGAEMAQGSHFSFLTTSGVNKIENRIYTFEADNKTKVVADRLDANCLVVGGHYQGASDLCYYRIDLKNYENDEYFNILRNHSYNITITSVTEEGVENYDDAYKGVSNIKANVEVWDEVTSEFQYGSNGRLYVSKRYLWVMLDGTTFATENSNMAYVRSTTTKQWEYISKPEWATLSAFSSPGRILIKYASDATTSNPNGRQGEAVIKAGDLQYTIYIMQGNCGMNGSPLVQMIGNYAHKTHLYPTGPNGAMQCWMVENSKEGLIGSSKGYGLDWTGAVLGTFFRDQERYLGLENGYYYTWEQRDNACPEGWVVPNQSQWESLKEYLYEDLEANDAVWWTGSRSPVNNAFAGAFQSNIWSDWNSVGLWWSSSSDYEFYRGSETSMIGPRNMTSPTLMNVRCVQE